MIDVIKPIPEESEQAADESYIDTTKKLWEIWNGLRK
ncbi:hypothetical protein Cflav_PD1620 [Pedosphaera parvula Ellin514]|uniref:Uncharacterized protein n=1 Tax=Pedosphaera parvula (strain Ellin514) TaxID=320771 RepID=B9XM00_PEDPL|nr:hypothetical protein Cflav_PD1620 [Pedosphaera parvula Ellin514]